LILPSLQLGFTLIELMVVLALGIVLMSLTVPAMTGMLNSQRVASLGSAFLASLNLARNEAIKRNARAVVCKSAAGVSCAASGGWEQGWIVFHDINNNAALDINEPVIEQQGAAAPGLSLSGNTPVANYVSYTASGSAKLIDGRFQSGTFTLCLDPVSSPDVRQIALPKTGRARIKKGTASDCM